jgi:SAM-dependent methyltransferase
MSEITEAVRERYAAKAKEIAGNGGGCGCGSDCCGGAATKSAATTTSTAATSASATEVCCEPGYSAEDLASIGLQATASLGCGNPTLLADLHPGERVLDLGSGAGIDVLLSAKRVTPGGHAYGVDMTDEMVALSQGNQERSGVLNATFLKGTIESVPLPDETVDVVISNCVINLAADKSLVLREAFRLLRPGGRFAVSDMVALRELPAETKARLDAWAGCIAGTISIDAYTDALRGAGFREVDVEVTDAMALEGAVASAYIRAVKPA